MSISSATVCAVQERSELISAHKLELDGLLEKRSGLEQVPSRQLAAAVGNGASPSDADRCDYSGPPKIGLPQR